MVVLPDRDEEFTGALAEVEELLLTLGWQETGDPDGLVVHPVSLGGGVALQALRRVADADAVRPTPGRRPVGGCWARTAGMSTCRCGSSGSARRTSTRCRPRRPRSGSRSAPTRSATRCVCTPGTVAIDRQMGGLGLGVVIVHLGDDGNYVVVQSWIEGYMSRLALFCGPAQRPDLLRPAPRGLAPCVWELAVLAHERDTFRATSSIPPIR